MNHSAPTSTATAQRPASSSPLSQPAAPPRPGTRRLVSALAVLAMLAASLVAVLVSTASPAAAQDPPPINLIIHNNTATDSAGHTADQRTVVVTFKDIRGASSSAMHWQ